jgi:hypothetical protein
VVLPFLTGAKTPVPPLSSPFRHPISRNSLIQREIKSKESWHNSFAQSVRIKEVVVADAKSNLGKGRPSISDTPGDTLAP